MKHAKLSASGSAQWLACAGSVKAQEGYEDQSSPAAAEGTCAHELAQICLEHDKNPHDHIGLTLFDAPLVEVNAEMANYVEEYVNYVKSFGGDLFVEVRVDFSKYVPEGFGTSDAIVYDEETETLHVIDLKYGKGIVVNAEENSQGKLYALGAIEDLQFIVGHIKNVVIHIYQPRVGNISEWSLTVEELEAWANDVLTPAAKLCLTDDAPRVAGEKQCQWCKAKATCSTLQAHIEETIGAEFDDLELQDVTSDLNYKAILGAKKLVEGWFKAVEAHLFSQLENGVENTGFKLVAGKSVRKWSDEVEAEKRLRAKRYKVDEIFTKKLITAPQAEKFLGKKFNIVEDLVVKTEGKPVLALESDKRPALNLNVSEDFEDLSE